MANNTVPEFGKRAAALRATRKSEPEPGRRLPGTAGRIYAELQDEDVEPVAVKTPEEIPGWSEEDYQNYQKAQGRGGDWSAPEMRNPDNDIYSRIARGVGKIKRLPGTLSYYAHKVADPMFANVDYMGRHLGEWGAKKINNIARAFDISPEARQYGRFEEEEYDPEDVDVRFGKNAYKEGYDSLEDYLEAKDQEKVDRYRGYNHADRFADIENPDDKWYSLSDTQTMEDWQPETTSGKIAKGAIEIAGNMLPENLKALMEEKGIEGGAKMLGALAPMYRRIVSEREEVNRLREAAKAETNPTRKAKIEATANKYERQYFRDKRDLEEATLNQRYAKKVVKPEEYNKAKATLSTEEFDTYTKDIGSGEYSNGSLRGRFAPTHKKLEDYENQSLAKMMRERAARGENPIPEYEVDDLGEYTGDYAKYFESGLEPAEKKAIVRSIRKGEPKPLPNPAAQREAAVAGRVQKELNEVAKEWESYNSWREWDNPAGKERALREVGETLKRAKNPVSRQAMLEYAKTNPGGGDLDLNTISTIERSVAEDLRRGIPKEDAIIRARIRCIDPYELMDEGSHGVLEAFENEGVLYQGDTGWDYTDVLREVETTGERVKNAATTAAAEAPRAAAAAEATQATAPAVEPLTRLQQYTADEVYRYAAENLAENYNYSKSDFNTIGPRLKEVIEKTVRNAGPNASDYAIAEKAIQDFLYGPSILPQAEELAAFKEAVKNKNLFDFAAQYFPGVDEIFQLRGIARVPADKAEINAALLKAVSEGRVKNPSQMLDMFIELTNLM